MSSTAANREVDALNRDGVRVEFKDEQGRNRKVRVKVIDFTDPASPRNQFLAVTQLWIQSTGAAAKAGYRRPDRQTSTPPCERSATCWARALS